MAERFNEIIKETIVRLYLQGSTRKEMQSMFHVGRGYAYELAKSRGRDVYRTLWSQTADARLKELWGTRTPQQIAEELNTTRNAVLGRAWRQGLSKKRNLKKDIKKP